ncbi:hypothetical protein VIGAN_01162500 [Vigna angularis var. angularis]|uniref:Uncharacterized protein n=1 Tax=Vigna angularis var. angularis TaxID=157739 RepID=A0A0S3R0E2_PHAAN|nr:hypothetical protein VIGAN_01162500 [Vigna angularis var. angularis]
MDFCFAYFEKGPTYIVSSLSSSSLALFSGVKSLSDSQSSSDKPLHCWVSFSLSSSMYSSPLRSSIPASSLLSTSTSSSLSTSPPS